MMKADDEMTAADLQRIWEQVPADYYQVATERNLLQRVWHCKRLQIIESLLDPGAERVLDLGCASGHFSLKIKEFLPQAQVVGADVYLPFLKEFRSRSSGLWCLQADAHALPFADGSFDAVVLSEVLDHVLYPYEVLEETARILGRGGKLIVSLDDLSLGFRLIWQFWVKMDPGRVWQGAHLHHFDSDQFEGLLEKAGFVIEQRRKGFLGMIRFFVASR